MVFELRILNFEWNGLRRASDPIIQHFCRE